MAKQIGDYIIKEGKNLIKVIIGVAHRESDLNWEAQRNHLGDYPGAKPAILVTKDKSIKLKAATVGVATIATSIIKKVLIILRRKSNLEGSS